MIDSPCIDAGCNISVLLYDFEGDIRPYDGSAQTRGDGSNYDIGADEFIVNKLTKEILCYHILGELVIQSDIFNQADINNDGIINICDLILFIISNE